MIQREEIEQGLSQSWSEGVVQGLQRARVEAVNARRFEDPLDWLQDRIQELINEVKRNDTVRGVDR